MTEQDQQNSPLIDPAAVNIESISADSSEKPLDVRKKRPTADQLGPKEYCWGTGRRKKAVARVRIRPGKGKITVNNRELDHFFPRVQDRNDVCAPLIATKSQDKYDVFIKLHGGGITGQAGAAMLGVARALSTADPEVFPILRDGGYLTRDSRVVERKKYGKKKARKSFQFSKR